MRRRDFYRLIVMYRHLLFNARNILMEKIRNRIKLNNCFNKIVNQLSIDYSNEEFQDIQSAVLEYLNRLTAKINERGLFKIVRIQPGGSMVERTAMWKMGSNGEPFTEFDFLAVLQAPNTFCPVESCEGCMVVPGCQLLNKDPDEKYPYSDVGRTINECFIEELRSAVGSCDCFSAEENEETICWPYYFSSCTATGCNKCTVSRSTGQLRILGKTMSDECSLTSSWTSNVKSLLAPISTEWSYKMQRIQNLEIKVDFLPALELFRDKQQSEHKCFLVPKKCPHPHCDGWRISQCLAEIDYFRTKISCEHKKCYKVVKYLFHFDQVDYCLSDQLTPYSIKTAVLNHCFACVDSSQSCADCVFNILREFRAAVRSGELTVFNGTANLFKKFQTRYANPTRKLISDLLYLLSQFRSRRRLELEFYQQAEHMNKQFMKKLREQQKQ